MNADAPSIDCLSHNSPPLIPNGPLEHTKTGRQTVTSMSLKNHGVHSRQWFVWLLSLAIVLSALHNPPFRLGDRLLLADLALVAMVPAVLAAIAEAYGSDRLVTGCTHGMVVLAIGYIIGISSATPNVEVLAALAREILPPIIFLGIVRKTYAAGSSVSSLGRLFVVCGLGVSVMLLLEESVRSQATFGNPNYAAHYVLAALAVLDALRPRRAVLLVLSALMVLGIAKTASFGSFAGLVGYACVRAWGGSGGLSTSRKHLVRMCLPIIAALTAAVLRARLLTPDSPADAISLARFERSSGSRGVLWSRAIRVWSENPLGIGFHGTIDGSPVFLGSANTEPHSDVLTALLNGGFLAVIGMVLIVWTICRQFNLSSRPNALLAAVVITGIFRQTWNFRHSWIALAIVLVLEANQQRPLRFGQPRVQNA